MLDMRFGFRGRRQSQIRPRTANNKAYLNFFKALSVSLLISAVFLVCFLSIFFLPFANAISNLARCPFQKSLTGTQVCPFADIANKIFFSSLLFSNSFLNLTGYI